MSIRDIWPLLLLLSAVVFLADVFVRRVTVTSDWILPAIDWVRQKLRQAPPDQGVERRLQRLQSKKAELAQSIDQRRAATRFDPQVDEPPLDQPSRDLDEILNDVTSSPIASRSPQMTPPQKPADQSESDSYTARLLEAKRKARQEQERKHKREE